MCVGGGPDTGKETRHSPKNGQAIVLKVQQALRRREAGRCMMLQSYNGQAIVAAQQLKGGSAAAGGGQVDDASVLQ